MLGPPTRFAIRSTRCRYLCLGKFATSSLLRRRCEQASLIAYTYATAGRRRGFLALTEGRTCGVVRNQMCATSQAAPSLNQCHSYQSFRRKYSFSQHGDLQLFQRSIFSEIPSLLTLVDHFQAISKRIEVPGGPFHACSVSPLLEVRATSSTGLLDDDHNPAEDAKISGESHNHVQLLFALARGAQSPRSRILNRRQTSLRNFSLRRQFSTNRSGSPPISDDQGTKPPKDEDVKKNQRTDADFAQYLSGTNDIEHITPVPPSPAEPVSQADDNTSSTPIQHYEWHHLHRDDPALGRPSTKETYRDIERRQQTNLERSRARTAANVRRALLGNVVIAASKLGAWMSSGSSAMLSEFVHSVVDCGNQSLLLLGLRDSGNIADRRHPYGYGKSVYFWALVSALGTFFLGAGVSMTNAVGELIEGPSLQEVTWQVWSVLGLSFAVDGYVLGKTIYDVRQEMPKDSSFFKYVQSLRDPATLAILLEDGAACLGIVIAIAGIGATQATSMPVFDGLAGVSISALLAAMGIILVRVNHRFLLGHAVDSEITEGIKKILLSQRSIEGVQSVQSQWTGPETFSYKAEVDFDGTFLAAKLMPRYQKEFLQARDTLDQELRVLLSWYAEDVMRTVERDIRHIEAEIRKEYPGAEYIELEPMSKDADRFAIDDGMEAQLKRIEIEALNRYLKSLYQPRTQKKDGDTKGDDGNQSGVK